MGAKHKEGAAAPAKAAETPKTIVVGANRTEEYVPILTSKKVNAPPRVGIVANQTSVISNNRSGYVHLIDSLLALGIDIKKVFAPEHGFRGTAGAGELVKDGVDKKTGLLVISLYGNAKKPSPEQLQDIDLMVFDIQDVGARFYTYISTLHYVMEACAELHIPLLILDRPNPNGHYVDGPLLEQRYQSFVGMHPVPIVHGITIGEYAQMINGERWLNNGVICELHVIPVKNYDHQTPYKLPIKPSPNLPNDTAIGLYPSLCLFEGTSVSIGRGTEMQFQIYGSPFLPKSDFYFIPKPNEGERQPLHNEKTCYGEDLRTVGKLNRLHLKWLIKAYNNTADKSHFFNSFFSKLAGTPVLQQQLEAGVSEENIRKSWEKDLEQFKKVREKYLIYD